MKKIVILRPTISQVMDLLGEWVVCRVDYPECNEVHYTTPSRIVGIIVPAPGSAVHAQLLMSDGSASLPVEGYEYELILEDVRSLQVVEATPDRRDSDQGLGTRIHSRFAVVATELVSGFVAGRRSGNGALSMRCVTDLLETEHLLASPTNAAHLERSLAQLEPTPTAGTESDVQ